MAILGRAAKNSLRGTAAQLALRGTLQTQTDIYVLRYEQKQGYTAPPALTDDQSYSIQSMVCLFRIHGSLILRIFLRKFFRNERRKTHNKTLKKIFLPFHPFYYSLSRFTLSLPPLPLLLIWSNQKRFIYRLLTRHGCLPVWLAAA